MKKLTLLFLLSLVFSGLAAQSSAKNSLSLYAGPNWHFQKTNIPFGAATIPHTGYQIGLQYAYEFRIRLEMLAGIQFNIWQSAFPSDPPSFLLDSLGNPPYMWGEEFLFDRRSQAMQYFTGIRWSTKGKTWRWQAELLSGVSKIKSDFGSNTKLRLTMQIGSGLEWSTDRFSWFLTPGFQYIYKETLNKNTSWFTFSNVTLNTGVRSLF